MIMRVMAANVLNIYWGTNVMHAHFDMNEPPFWVKNLPVVSKCDSGYRSQD